jgi:RNA polymerase sigma factor (sigma-70 family)
MQSTDDSALLRQFAENDSDEAFAALVERHVNLVYSVAFRQVGDPHHAEEITQVVFIILAKKAKQLHHQRALSSWLFQTTRLTARNFLRSETRRLHREQEAYMQSVLNESGDETWVKIAPLLDGAVANLREKDRQAILFRFYEGRNLSEVGKVLQISEDAAEKRVSRALEKLRKFFLRHDIASTTTVIAGIVSANSVQAAPVGLAKTISAVAVTKGAAVSASSLTLIKGALKIMAWTKMKTAAVVGAVVILAAGTATGLVIQQRRHANSPVAVAASSEFSNQKLQGGWKGSNTAHPGQTCTVNISGDQIKYRGAEPNDWLRGKFVLNESVEPKQLNITIVEPANGIVLCIYRVNGDKISIAAAEHGSSQRPADFRPGRKVDILELQRN